MANTKAHQRRLPCAATSIRSNSASISSAVRYSPEAFASLPDCRPRSMKWCCNSLCRICWRIDCSTKLERLSPSRSTFSAALRSSGSTRTEGKLEDFISKSMHRNCDALCSLRLRRASGRREERCSGADAVFLAVRRHRLLELRQFGTRARPGQVGEQVVQVRDRYHRHAVALLDFLHRR